MGDWSNGICSCFNDCTICELTHVRNIYTLWNYARSCINFVLKWGNFEHMQDIAQKSMEAECFTQVSFAVKD